MPSGDTDPVLLDEAPNRVTDIYGTVGGGYGNVAGNDNGFVNDAALAMTMPVNVVGVALR